MLKNDDILLRKVEPQDLPLLYLWENDSEAWGVSDTHNPLSQKDLQDYILSSTGDIYKDGQLRLIIETNKSGAKSTLANVLPDTLGSVDIFNFDPHHRRAAVGIYLLPEARERGIATMALHLMTEYAFRFLRLRVLYAIVASTNAASIRLFTSAGWLNVATLPQWLNESDAIVFETTNQLPL